MEAGSHLCLLLVVIELPFCAQLLLTHQEEKKNLPHIYDTLFPEIQSTTVIKQKQK